MLIIPIKSEMSPHFYTTQITKKSWGQFKHEMYFFLSPLLDWSWHGKEPLPAQSGDTFTPHETRKHSASLPTSRVERTFIISWRILEFLYRVFTDLPVSRPSFRNQPPFISAGKAPITKISTRMSIIRAYAMLTTVFIVRWRSETALFVLWCFTIREQLQLHTTGAVDYQSIRISMETKIYWNCIARDFPKKYNDHRTYE